MGAIPEEEARPGSMGQPIERALPSEVGDRPGHEVALVEVVPVQEVFDGTVEVAGGELAEGVAILVGDIWPLTSGNGGNEFGRSVDRFPEVTERNCDVRELFLKDLNDAFCGGG